LDVVAVSSLMNGSALAKAAQLYQRIRTAVASADVVHMVSFPPLFPLYWNLVRKKPVLLGPNISGPMLPREFLVKEAQDAFKEELPYFWWRWHFGGGELMERLNIRLGGGADRIISLSDYSARIIAKRGIERERVMVMPFAAPLIAAGPEAENALQDVKAPRIAYAGRLDNRKGFGLFLKTVARVNKDARFVVFGDGRMRPELQAAAQKDRRIVWLGRKPRAELLSLLPFMNLYFQPSPHEAVATTVFEALRAGVPVLSADISAHREVAEQIGGVQLFPAGNANAASAALVKMLEQLSKLRSEANEASGRLEVKPTAEWLAAIYRELATHRNS
jgi:glycosyltransferase involved in cell wall biosynthesis